MIAYTFRRLVFKCMYVKMGKGETGREKEWGNRKGRKVKKSKRTEEINEGR